MFQKKKNMAQIKENLESIRQMVKEIIFIMSLENELRTGEHRVNNTISCLSAHILNANNKLPENLEPYSNAELQTISARLRQYFIDKIPYINHNPLKCEDIANLLNTPNIPSLL